MNTSSELAPVMTTQSTKNFERERILTLFSGKKISKTYLRVLTTFIALNHK